MDTIQRIKPEIVLLSKILISVLILNAFKTDRTNIKSKLRVL
jgi:hypothetical protein